MDNQLVNQKPTTPNMTSSTAYSPKQSSVPNSPILTSTNTNTRASHFTEHSLFSKSINPIGKKGKMFNNYLRAKSKSTKIPTASIPTSSKLVNGLPLESANILGLSLNISDNSSDNNYLQEMRTSTQQERKKRIFRLK